MAKLNFRVSAFLLMALVSSVLVTHTGCGSKGQKKREIQLYETSRAAQPLQIPADLQALEKQRTYEIPALPPEVTQRPLIDPEELAKPPALVEEAKAEPEATVAEDDEDDEDDEPETSDN